MALTARIAPDPLRRCRDAEAATDAAHLYANPIMLLAR